MKKQLLIISLLSAIILLSGCTLQTKVSGTVVDAASGTPLPGATVEIDGLDISSTTNASGKFALENISPGQRTLKISKENYISFKVDLTVKENDLELGKISLVEKETLETESPIESVRVLSKDKTRQVLQENPVLSDYYDYASELGFMETEGDEKFFEAEIEGSVVITMAVFFKPEKGEVLYLFSPPESELPFFARVPSSEAEPIEVFDMNGKIMQIAEEGITLFSGDENVFIAYEEEIELQLQRLKVPKVPPPDKPSVLDKAKCYGDCILNCISPNKTLGGIKFAGGQIACRACPTFVFAMPFSEGLSGFVAVPACLACATYLVTSARDIARCWRETCSRYPGIYSTYEDYEDDKWPNTCDTCPTDFNPEQEPANCKHCPHDYRCDWYKHCNPDGKCVDCLEDKHCTETAIDFDQDSDCRTYSCKQYKCESIPDPAKDGKPCLVGELQSGYTATCQNGECIVSAKESKCGDGVCEGNENIENCFEDCYKEECGNGICGEGEDHENCPDDCEPADEDGDGIPDEEDNCPTVQNADQLDSDADGMGDACDVCPNDSQNDADNDGVCGDVDNCSDVANSGQEDADSDGMGDACDPCPNDPENLEGCAAEDPDEQYLQGQGYAFNESLVAIPKVEDTILCRYCAYNSEEDIWEDLYVDGITGSGPLNKDVIFYIEADSSEYFHHSYIYPDEMPVYPALRIVQYVSPTIFSIRTNNAGEYQAKIRKIDETNKQYGPALTFTWTVS